MDLSVLAYNDKPHTSLLIDKASAYLQQYPLADVKTETHTLFISPDKSIILKRYELKELIRPLNAVFLSSLSLQLPILENIAVISTTNSYFLISKYILQKEEPMPEDQLLENNLVLAGEFHQKMEGFSETNTPNSSFVNLSSIQPGFEGFSYQDEFVERAIITRDSDKQDRFQILPQLFRETIMNEYRDLFPVSRPQIYIIHGDCKKENVVTNILVDLDHVRKSQDIEYDYARMLTFDVSLLPQSIDQLIQTGNYPIDIERFWANMFHQAITLSAYAFAQNYQEAFKKYSRKALYAAQKVQNEVLEKTVADYVLPLEEK